MKHGRLSMEFNADVLGWQGRDEDSRREVFRATHGCGFIPAEDLSDFILIQMNVRGNVVEF